MSRLLLSLAVLSITANAFAERTNNSQNFVVPTGELLEDHHSLTTQHGLMMAFRFQFGMTDRVELEVFHPLFPVGGYGQIRFGVLPRSHRLRLTAGGMFGYVNLDGASVVAGTNVSAGLRLGRWETRATAMIAAAPSRGERYGLASAGVGVELASWWRVGVDVTRVAYSSPGTCAAVAKNPVPCSVGDGVHLAALTTKWAIHDVDLEINLLSFPEHERWLPFVSFAHRR